LNDCVFCSGQRPTDGSPLDDPSRRPTSYEPGLVECYRRGRLDGAGGRHGHHRRVAVAAAERHRSRDNQSAAGSTTVHPGGGAVIALVVVVVYQLI